MAYGFFPLVTWLAVAPAWAGPAARDPAPPEVVRCTDRGPLVLRAEGETLRGTLGPWAVDGVADRVVARDAAGREVWAGPVRELAGRDLPPVDREAVAARFAVFGKMKARGASVRGRGVKAEVDPFGVLRGTWKGDAAAWALDLAAEGVFGGTLPPGAPLRRLRRQLAAGDPFAAHAADPAAALATVVSAHATAVGAPPACGAGGDRELRLGRWRSPIPIAEGRRVAWLTEDEALVRGPEGAAWYLLGPMGAAQAAELAGELARTRGGRVAWEDGLAAVLVTSDPAQTLPGPAVTPTPGGLPLLGLLHVDPAALRPEAPPARAGSFASPGLDVGVEMGHRVNAARRSAGLPLVDLDPGLAWGALGHCAWVDANPGSDPTRQEPDTALFLAESPADRGGASELVLRDPGGAPAYAVARWLETPSSRALLLHPRATAVGACATPGGARVMEVRVPRGSGRGAVFSLPLDGGTATSLRGFGDDPLYRRVVGEGAAGPPGPPVTIWVETPPTGFQVQTSQILDGDGGRVPHVVVRSTESPEGLRASDVSVHLVPRAPLRSGQAYTWELTYTVGGAPHTRRGAFQAPMDPGAAAPPLDAVSTRVLALLDEKRAASGVAPLVPAVAETQAARMVAASRTTAGVDRLVPGGVGWYCAATGWYATWLAAGPDGLDARLDPLGLDPGYGRVGAAVVRGELCLLFSRVGGKVSR